MTVLVRDMYHALGMMDTTFQRKFRIQPAFATGGASPTYGQIWPRGNVSQG